MTATGLINGLRKRGGDLYLEDDRVRYSGPEGLMTDSLLSALREHKSQIAELLASEPPTEQPAYAPSKDMRLAEFKASARVVTLWSEVLQEKVLFAGDAAVFDNPDGLIVYCADELSSFLGTAPDKLRELHDLKRRFAMTDLDVPSASEAEDE